MKTVFFLDCSPYAHPACRDPGVGTQLIHDVLEALKSRYAGLGVVHRSLAASPLPPVSDAYARAITSSSPLTDSVFGVSEQLITEFEHCDAVLISTPMHNFTVPANLKLWIDHIVRRGRTFDSTRTGKVGRLKDRSTLVLVRSGSPCGESPGLQTDFLTPYLRYVLSSIGIQRTDFVYLPGVVPDADEIAAARQALTRSSVLQTFYGES